MPSLRIVYLLIRWAVACGILAIGLRTWLVMGLIEPVTVVGSSMAPTLRGTFVRPRCSECLHAFSVGAEYTTGNAIATCPQCGNVGIPLDSLPLQPGDSLWIDRTALIRRRPRRWELVVVRNPTNAEAICIKRIVGLPGERVELQNGDVLVDGAVVVKSIEEQRLLRQAIHRELSRSRRWQSTQLSHWRYNENVWRTNSASTDVFDSLHYQQPQGCQLTDDNAYNAGLTRRLHLVDEFMLAMDLTAEGEGVIRLAIDDGTASAQVDLQLPGGEITVLDNANRSAEFQLSPLSLQRIVRGKVQLELSNFDGQLLLAIDGRVEMRRSWPSAQAKGVDRPVWIGSQGLDVSLDSLALYHDLYHSSQLAGAVPPLATQWQLGADEYFLLGDNAPVSLDSRLWGPVPRQLMLGTPLGSGR